ncbi:MAG TPA: NADH-quinone oxidoreductase subunit L [Candidatus Polarisedimenticolaceae bacterium]
MTWAILCLAFPLAALAALGVIAPLRRSGRPAAWLSILAMTGSLVSAIAAYFSFHASKAPVVVEWLWAPMKEFDPIRFGILLDGVSAPMIAVVALVSLLVQVYSLEYMREETPGSLGRYYAFHSLFSFAMLGLVLAHNTLQTYVFWELVGLGSYLLIGFWYRKPEAARAALKAFWTTRLGDVGFAFGVVVLWYAGGTFVFSELFERTASGTLAGTALALGVGGLYVGAMGKSAQFPLHIWLPDAMEGPTPVSALIHAATMVAAGVYLMIRVSPLLAAAPEVAAWVLGIGAFTALIAASMALVERDIKRVLAFSTVSQLGYMMAAVGAGAATAAYFHLVTHAFFKALLFLGAGALIHATHTNDLFAMGGLWKPMRRTGIVFLAGAIALCGVWPTSGFFSKDEILAGVFASGHPIAFVVLLLTAFLTAFYMFRAFFVAFFGARRDGGHAHEAPLAMAAPMGVLAVLALVAGALQHSVPETLGASISFPGLASEVHPPLWIAACGTLAAVSGIALAYTGYLSGRWSPAGLKVRFATVARVLERRWYVDDLIEGGYRVVYLGLTRVVGWFDRYVVDGVVNLATHGTWRAGTALRVIANGRVQDALMAIAIGFLLLAVMAMGWRG